MSFTYWLHHKIQDNINEAFAWYEEQQPGLGGAFLKAVETKIEEIVDHPETFGSKANLLFREARVDRFPFVIVYRVYNAK